MARVIRSPLTEEDFREIWRYIAQDNPDAADKLLRRIDEKLLLYAEYPRMGTSREHWVPGVRSFSVGKYVVFYRIVAEGIELVRVLHGMRDMKALLKRKE